METMSRLIEECREEEERLSIMQEMEADYGQNKDDATRAMQVHSAMKNERSRQQLAKMDGELRLLNEADEVVQDLEGIKGTYFEMVEKVGDREKSIAVMETTVNQLLKANEVQISKQKKKEGLKNKVTEVDQEIKQILESLDNKEAFLQIVQEKERLLASEYDSIIPS